MAMPGEKKAPDWVKVTDQAGWQPRDSQGEVVHQDQLWILGGWFNSFEAPPRDVWSSHDGKNWLLVQETAPWKHSDLPMALAFDNKIWVLEGCRFNYERFSDGLGPDGGNLNDVWFSEDGDHWHELPDTPWAKRHAASVFVYQDALWMVAGNHMGRDVWKLTKNR